jgi:hypothetical protein
MKQQTFKCKNHGEFIITEEQDKNVLTYINYECPICNTISTKADYCGLRFKGLPNTKS